MSNDHHAGGTRRHQALRRGYRRQPGQLHGPPGEVLGYLGPNGSGKSTTVKMITGLMPPTSGTILFDGIDIQTQLLPITKPAWATSPRKHTSTRISRAPEPAPVRAAAWGLTRHPRTEDRPLPEAVQPRHRLPRAACCVLEGHAAEDSAVGRAAPQSGSGRARRTRVRAGRLDRTRAAAVVHGAGAHDGRIIFYSSHELETVEKISTRVMILRSRARGRRRLGGGPA